MKHLTSLAALSSADVHAILDIAAALKVRFKQGERPPVLQGRVLAMVFEKPSLRTRNSFEAAMLHLGGGAIFLSSKDAGLNGREALVDVAQVLGSYSDAIALRTFSQQLIDEFAENAGCPIINALSDERHPCQALTDLLTLQEICRDLTQMHLVYIGDGNNIARSLVTAAGQVNMPITVCSPPGYELSEPFLANVRAQFPNIRLTLTQDPVRAVQDAGAVYTDVWASMGQESEAAERRKIFQPYQVNAALMAKAPRDCLFMHDLPAHRGEEVTDEVIDGPRSIVFEQAANRMHLAKGLLVWLLDAAVQ